MAVVKVCKLLAWVISFVMMTSSSYFGDAADDHNEALGASFVFGDSLVDAGNNNYLPTLSKANIRPNGIDFKASGGNPTGRYTNGRTIADIVGKLIISGKHINLWILQYGTSASVIYYAIN